MGSIDRSEPVILGHVLAEHRDLFQLMQSVRSAFAARGAPTPDRRTELLGCLRDLREHLREHFTREEQGGFLEESVNRVPRLSAAVRSILRQHPSLLAELDGVIEALAAEAATVGDETADAARRADQWQRADQAFELFSAHMAAHERSENTVVQEGYNEDLGLAE
jgi:hypothetical protein